MTRTALADHLLAGQVGFDEAVRRFQQLFLPRPEPRPPLDQAAQDADVIWALYRDEQYHSDSMDKGLAELLWLKNRYGEGSGMTPLVWKATCVRFDSMFGELPSAAAERSGESSGEGRKGFDSGRF